MEIVTQISCHEPPARYHLSRLGICRRRKHGSHGPSSSLDPLLTHTGYRLLYGDEDGIGPTVSRECKRSWWRLSVGTLASLKITGSRQLWRSVACNPRLSAKVYTGVQGDVSKDTSAEVTGQEIEALHCSAKKITLYSQET